MNCHMRAKCSLMAVMASSVYEDILPLWKVFKFVNKKKSAKSGGIRRVRNQLKAKFVQLFYWDGLFVECFHVVLSTAMPAAFSLWCVVVNPRFACQELMHEVLRVVTKHCRAPHGMPVHVRNFFICNFHAGFCSFSWYAHNIGNLVHFFFFFQFSSF